MILIGLNGRAHSGKDTAYKIIEQAVNLAGLSAQRICFADKMKFSGMRALGFNPESVEEAVQLADVLKEHGFVTTSWKIENITHHKTVSGREWWQRYGTEAHREVFGDEFWVDVLLPKADRGVLLNQGVFPEDDMRVPLNDANLKKRFPGVSVLVETTTRFPNEAERILDLAGTVWRIDADERLGALPPNAHISEYGLPDELVTHVIDNNGTEDQFRSNVLDALAELI